MARRNPDIRLRKTTLAVAALAVAVSAAAATVVALGAETRAAVATAEELDRIVTLDGVVRLVAAGGGSGVPDLERLAAPLDDPALDRAVERLAADLAARRGAAGSVEGVLAITEDRARELRGRLDAAGRATVTPSMVGLVLVLLAIPAAVITSFQRYARKRAVEPGAGAPAPAATDPHHPGPIPGVESSAGVREVERGDDEAELHAVLSAVIGQMSSDDVVISLQDPDSLSISISEHPEPGPGVVASPLGPLLREAARRAAPLPVQVAPHDPASVAVDRESFVAAMTELFRTVGRRTEVPIGVAVIPTATHVDVAVGPVPEEPNGAVSGGQPAGLASVDWVETDGEWLAVTRVPRPETSDRAP